MKAYRRKLFLKAVLISGCLFEAVGCPQIFGNALRDGTRSFIDTGLANAILSAFNIGDLP